jgi:predicted enzyme related to lactoylglutathione lyase
MQRVTGIGGVFFKAKDPVALRAWYQQHLGVDIQVWGGAVFRWGGTPSGSTAWCIKEAADEKEFAPSKSSFMINYRVADLHALLAALKAEGCDVVDTVDESENFGKFGWVMDPEG